jgi:hypothetical protein
MRRHDIDDDDSLPVMVPRSDKVLVTTSATRVRRLREHLIRALQELRTAKHSDRFASLARPEPTGFPARVARSACSLCKGWCCRNGDDDAFLDDRTLARVRLARPDMDERSVLRLYLALRCLAWMVTTLRGQSEVEFTGDKIDDRFEVAH